ncbi:Amino Acid/Auxin Permease (AAAP) Family [Thraustotheca clavata]|uniref:Amino Acid/Auxin Permease (AAAP) Family n=1 Tax=Thraustotheca clavata TaxID=74557 RepID=A0A1V9ZYR2_9STRA|nr:Amino Acid/Auxin Permease (AAAP) Family [Thraustotheca clavata]
MSYFDLEDAKAAFNLFCCVYGIGTLGMPGNFARAGPLWGSLALAFMGFANVYASVVCSKVMLLAPSHVHTFADVGDWALGRTGRILVILSQMGVCLFVPCAFLVLGGTLLDTVVPDAFTPRNWTIIMAITLLPITLVPTLKEGAGAALAGCIGTILADFIALGVLVYYMSPFATVELIPSPEITFDSIASTFGNLSLAYGAAIVIPDLQRQHSNPRHMPRVVFATLLLVSVLFCAIAITGYTMVGCQIPGNLLFAVSGTLLGFKSPRGPVVLAFMAMQLHITIGFNVLLHPSFYYAERYLLGVHQSTEHNRLPDTDVDESTITTASTADECEEGNDTREYPQQVSLVANDEETSSQEKVTINQVEENPRFLACSLVRIAIVIALTIVSVILHDHFHELVDLIGASSVSMSCIILPILSYLAVFAGSIPWYERLYCYIVITICAILSIYVTFKSARAMLQPVNSDITFPFCPAKYQHFVYTNFTHYTKL